MKRIPLTDEYGEDSGAWFDVDKAEKFEETLDWDGRNKISRPTGSQWEHEALYRTATGRWVLNRWSNVSGGSDTYREISAAAAAAWLIKDGDELPEDLLPYAEKLEI